VEIQAATLAAHRRKEQLAFRISSPAVNVFKRAGAITVQNPRTKTRG
jgi:hypothetical protein